MRKGWSVTSRLTVEHESKEAKVTLVPAETRRNSKHFIVYVKGNWIYQKTWIKPFKTLTEALNAAEAILCTS